MTTHMTVLTRSSASARAEASPPMTPCSVIVHAINSCSMKTVSPFVCEVTPPNRSALMHKAESLTDSFGDVVPQPSPGVVTRKCSQSRQHAPSPKLVFFQSPPRQILTARFATIKKRSRHEADGSPASISLANITEDQLLRIPAPRFGYASLARSALEQRICTQSLDTVEQGMKRDEMESCDSLSLDVPFPGSVSGLRGSSVSALSQTHSRSVAVETPPGGSEAFGFLPLPPNPVRKGAQVPVGGFQIPTIGW